MKKGLLVLLMALCTMLVTFSTEVSGQWAGMKMPGGKRDSNYNEVSIGQRAISYTHAHHHHTAL